MQRIYLDHAATTPLDKEVFEKMTPYFTESFGNADSPHFYGRKAMGAVDTARDKIAMLIGAKPSEIYFTSGGTESDNWAVIGGAYAKRKEGKTHVLVSSIEHHAVLAAAEKLAKDGFEVEYIPVNEQGRVEIQEVKKRLKDTTALVAVMAANNETGVVQPYQEIAKIAKANGSLCFVDAVQLAPYAPINVTEIGAEMLSFSAHKFHGPKGVGVLYIKDKVRIEKLLAGGEQERGLRGGTTNVPSVVGLAYAYEKCVLEQSKTQATIKRLKEKFLDGLKGLDGMIVNGDKDNPTGILNLRFVGVENAAFLYNMDLNGVAVAAGSACASASVKPSHVLLAMGLDEVQAKESVRFSFGKDNTDEEVEIAVRLVKETVERIRKA